MKSSQLNMASPWFTLFHKIKGVFSVDKELHVDEDLTENEDGSYQFMIASQNGDKLAAIEKLLGTSYTFGNVRLIIKYGYENQAEEENWREVYETAFKGNPYFREVIEKGNPVFGQLGYAVFAREILSFFDDNLMDYKGYSHFVVADAVRDFAKATPVRPCSE
jgi:hypothetical protein